MGVKLTRSVCLHDILLGGTGCYLQPKVPTRLSCAVEWLTAPSQIKVHNSSVVFPWHATTSRPRVFLSVTTKGSTSMPAYVPLTSAADVLKTLASELDLSAEEVCICMTVCPSPSVGNAYLFLALVIIDYLFLLLVASWSD